jgi:aromatic ring-opening dioxygenase catalytic subunit (LigB family)
VEELGQTMAEIVGAFGVPHTPHFPTLVARGAPVAAELERLYGTVASHLEAVQADTILLLTSDHYNIFFEQCLPIFSIGVAECARGPSDYPDLPAIDVRIDAELARGIQRHVVRAGFDVGMSQEFELDHAATVPLHFLTPRLDVPIVPLFTSAFVRPIPTSQRCHALGRAIREALEGTPDRTRVAVVATGSFSLEIGGPRISADSHTGVPSPQWVERVVSLLRSGDVARLVREATDEQLDRAGNAGGELLDWIEMLATFDPRPPAFLEAQPEHGHAYAAWPIDVPGRRPAA